jgi:hypothetical protein
MLQLDPRAVVEGRVVSRDGPVADIAIHVGFWSTPWWGSARTRDDGSFSIEHAPVGLTLARVDGHAVLSPKTLRVPEEGLSGILVEVEAQAQLRVTVLKDRVPVPGATVLIRSTLAGQTGRTEPDGVATFKGVAESTYQVTAEHEHDFAVRDGVRVAKGKVVDVTVELRPGRDLAGKVIDEQGGAVDGALVAFGLSIGETRASASRSCRCSCTASSRGSICSTSPRRRCRRSVSSRSCGSSMSSPRPATPSSSSRRIRRSCSVTPTP